MKIKTILFCSTLLLISSCKKEKLEGDLEAFRGKYNWVGYSGRNCAICEIRDYSSDGAGFTTGIEFDNSGKVTFYIDGEEYLEKKFKVTHQERISDEAISITIKVDVPKSKLDINDKLTLTLANDTLLTINNYPYQGYKSIDRVITGNTFIKE